ncbi:hypothetical protein BJY52DRAFT_1417939 [Lactarius psammicola]|nr:hypothetical protein BJY52DRAFT_1417939 [Lactarius psammicola]
MASNSDRDMLTNRVVAEEHIRGIYKDSSGKLWSIYLTEADEQDEEITELWREEADSILVFTGLFSGFVATFISISYNDLFPNTTEDLLRQISRQLVDISNGVPSQAFIDEAFTPPAYAIRVNVIWYLSLVLSMASALNATLFQQWSRRYLDITRRRVAPHKRARTRAYMFDGISSFKMSEAVKAMPMLLHLSMFLFFAGLIDYLWHSNTTIGRWVFGFISVFAFAYFVLTVLPNLYLNCPYSTPLSELSWRLSQHLLLFILHSIQFLEGLLLNHLLLGRQPAHHATGTQEPSRWTRWREALAVETRINERQKWLEVGLQDSIVLNATKAPSTTDENALSWTLTTLDDDREFEDFVARVPGFFESDSVKDASSVMLSLMTDQPSQPSQPSQQPDQFDPVLGSCINDLLETCVPGTSPLKEELRKNRLRICLRTLWYFAREYNRPGNRDPLSSYVRTTFADPELTRRIQSEKDIATHLIGRSFSSLVVKKLARDIDSRTVQVDPEIMEAELSCLAAILDKTSAEVVTLLSQPGAISLANISSLTSSVENTLNDSEGRVPSEVLDIFLMTLDILFTEDPRVPLKELLSGLFEDTSPLGRRLRAPDLRVDRLREILDRSSDEIIMSAMPEPEPGLRSSIGEGGETYTGSSDPEGGWAECDLEFLEEVEKFVGLLSEESQ